MWVAEPPLTSGKSCWNMRIWELLRVERPSYGPGLQSTLTKPTEGHDAELLSQTLLTLSQNCQGHIRKVGETKESRGVCGDRM